MEAINSLFEILSAVTFGKLCLTLLSYVLLSFSYQIIYYRFFHPLSIFPGPFWATVTRLHNAYYLFTGKDHLYAWELHKKYGMSMNSSNARPRRRRMTHSLRCIGPVVRVSPTLLVVSDATFLPIIYNRYVDKSQHYVTGSFGEVESVFSMQKHKQHAHHRKIVAGPVCYLLPTVIVKTDGASKVQLLERQEDGATDRCKNPGLDFQAQRYLCQNGSEV